MSQHDKPADKGQSAPVAATSQDERLLPGSPGGDPVAAAEEHLASVDMAAQRAIVRQLTK